MIAAAISSPRPPTTMPNGVEASAGARIRHDILKLVLAIVAAVLLAWLVVRSAAVNALVESDPAAAALVAPHDPRAALALPDALLRQERGAVAQAPRDRALPASLRAPPPTPPSPLARPRALPGG